MFNRLRTSRKGAPTWPCVTARLGSKGHSPRSAGSKGWVYDHLPSEDEQQSSKPLDFLPWVSREIRRSLLESLDVGKPLTAEQMPAIEANLERYRYRLDELEEDVGIRAGAIRVPVLPLFGLATG